MLSVAVIDTIAAPVTAAILSRRPSPTCTPPPRLLNRFLQATGLTSMFTRLTSRKGRVQQGAQPPSLSTTHHSAHFTSAPMNLDEEELQKPPETPTDTLLGAVIFSVLWTLFLEGVCTRRHRFLFIFCQRSRRCIIVIAVRAHKKR